MREKMKRKMIRYLLAVIACFFIFQGSLLALTERTVASTTEMTNLTGLTNGDLTNVSSGSGIDGQFRFVSGSSTTADNALVFSANNGRWVRVYNGGLNVKWYGALGNGTLNDAPAIQNCLDAASSKQAKVYFPNGCYRITAPLDLKSNLSLCGQGRNFGTVIMPVNCYAFKIDGRDKVGDWVFRIRISDMLIRGDFTSNTYGESLIKMTNAYNVEIVRVWIYNQMTTNGIEISACNAITLEDCIAYGSNQASCLTTGIFINDNVDEAKVRIVRPDIEEYYSGIKISGEVITDIEAPYSERCIINIDHSTTGNGSTTVIGGILSSINGYCLAIRSNNFNLIGTVLQSFTGANLNGPVVYANATSLCNNVNVRPGNDYIGAIHDPYINYAAIDVNKNISGMKSGKIKFKKNVADNISTNLFTIANCDTAKVKLTVCAAHAYAQVIKTYEFMISGSVVTALPVISSIIDESSGNYKILLTPAISTVGTLTTISVNANQSGVLLEGQAVTVFGTMEYTLIDSANCTIRRISN